MNEIFEKFKNLKVLVIGDVILDKYYNTNVSRISPEAPVPVAKFEYENLTLGGSANVALNLSSLGVQTSVIGKIGIDKDGQEIQRLFEENNIDFNPIFVTTQTISKIRIVSKSNQLLRLDFEEVEKYKSEEFNIIKTEINRLIDDIDIMIVSDYQKGVVDEDLIEYLSKSNKYISIDTKPGSFKEFNNFSLIKPNFNEAVGIAKSFGNFENFSNSNKDVEKLGKYLKEKLNCNFLITRSEMGASYIGDKTYHSSIENNEVIDVTGAGDTCISIFSCLDYLDVEKEKALEIMNAAAKIAVSKFGTYAPSINEIKNILMVEEFENVLTQDKLEIVVSKLKQEGKKIVFTNGCFDLLHKGHVSYLNKAKENGDILIVGLNSDSSVKKLKGESRPIIDESSRAFVLSNLKCVDYVVIFEEDNPIEIIKKIKPEFHVKGGDYDPEKMIETSTVRKFGGEVRIVKFDLSVSTSKIVKNIKKNG